MDTEYLRKLEALDYANLKEDQEKRLRELEKKFNEEFRTDFYFMVMKREH